MQTMKRNELRSVLQIPSGVHISVFERDPLTGDLQLVRTELFRVCAASAGYHVHAEAPHAVAHQLQAIWQRR